MRKVLVAAAALVLSFGAANAEGNKNYNNSSSNSASFARSSSRATGGAGGNASASNNGNSQTTNFRDRLQAPGFGVGGGYCSNGLSISFPGGGFGFSSMERMCKVEIGARVAKSYLGSNSAAQYVCSQR